MARSDSDKVITISFAACPAETRAARERGEETTVGLTCCSEATNGHGAYPGAIKAALRAEVHNRTNRNLPGSNINVNTK